LDAYRKHHEEKQPPHDYENQDATEPGHTSGLFNLDERAETVLGMQKYDRLAVRSNAGEAVVKDVDPVRRELFRGCRNIFNFETQMMDSSGRVALEKFSDRRIVSEGMQKFDFRIGKDDEYCCDPMLRQFLRRRDLGPEGVPVSLGSSLEIGHHDGHMI
jgi:hypothetical protein